MARIEGETIVALIANGPFTNDDGEEVATIPVSAAALLIVAGYASALPPPLVTDSGRGSQFTARHPGVKRRRSTAADIARYRRCSDGDDRRCRTLQSFTIARAAVPAAGVCVRP